MPSSRMRSDRYSGCLLHARVAPCRAYPHHALPAPPHPLHPPPVVRMIHACENISVPQLLLREVIMYQYFLAEYYMRKNATSRLLSRSEENEEEGYCVLKGNFSCLCLDSAYVVDGVTARLRVTASSASNIPLESEVRDNL